MNTTLFAAVAVSSITALSTAVQAAESAAKDTDAADTRRCFTVTRIDRTDIIDKQHIVFEVGNQLYLNTLPHRCHSLSRHATLSYKASNGRLCDLNIITTLETVGGELTQTGSCGLGPFTAISQQQRDDLKAKIKTDGNKPDSR